MVLLLLPFIIAFMLSPQAWASAHHFSYDLSKDLKEDSRRDTLRMAADDKKVVYRSSPASYKLRHPSELESEPLSASVIYSKYSDKQRITKRDTLTKQLTHGQGGSDHGSLRPPRHKQQTNHATPTYMLDLYNTYNKNMLHPDAEIVRSFLSINPGRLSCYLCLLHNF